MYQKYTVSFAKVVTIMNLYDQCVTNDLTCMSVTKLGEYRSKQRTLDWQVEYLPDSQGDPNEG